MPDAFEQMVRLLASREHSAQELRAKLLAKGFAEDAINDALNQAMHQGLQSDARYAEMQARARVRRGYGPQFIRQLLRQAGISGDIIQQALDELSQTIHWQDEIERVRAKKFRDPNVPILKQKQFLRYRGFTEDMIRELFDEIQLGS